jgi:hypothetical protein
MWKRFFHARGTSDPTGRVCQAFRGSLADGGLSLGDVGRPGKRRSAFK